MIGFGYLSWISVGCLGRSYGLPNKHIPASKIWDLRLEAEWYRNTVNPSVTLIIFGAREFYLGRRVHCASFYQIGVGCSFPSPSILQGLRSRVPGRRSPAGVRISGVFRCGASLLINLGSIGSSQRTFVWEVFPVNFTSQVILSWLSTSNLISCSIIRSTECWDIRLHTVQPDFIVIHFSLKHSLKARDIKRAAKPIISALEYN